MENAVFIDIRLYIYKRSCPYEQKRELTITRMFYTVLGVLTQIIH